LSKIKKYSYSGYLKGKKVKMDLKIYLILNSYLKRDDCKKLIGRLKPGLIMESTRGGERIKYH